MKTRKVVLLLMILMLILIPFTPASADGETMRVERVYGASRFDTAVAISKACFTDTDYVVVSSGSNFPDALAGGVLAETVKAPVLLVHKDSLPSTTEKEIARLTPTTIYVLGGDKAISESVASKLATYGSVKRLYGTSRFDTAEAIAKEIRTLDPNTSTAFGVVNAYNFADALGASALLAKQNMPLMLDQPGLEATRETVLFGGIAAVPHKPYGDRIAGLNRVATSLAIAKVGFPEAKTVILTNGWNYPDALSAISLSVKFDAPIILTGSNALDPAITEYIKANKINHAIIIGGEKAISKGVENAVLNVYATPAPTPEPPTAQLYDVVRVVDGDTIIVNVNGVEERIRLIGIDTPESVHPDPTQNNRYGTIASDYTKNLLTGKKVSLELDVQERDKYGRLLAYVYLDGVMVNKTLLQAGMAQVSTYPPNVKYVDDFLALQKTARDNNVGLWGIEEPVTPPTPPSTGTPTKEKYYNRTQAELDKVWVDANGNGLIKGNINSGEKIYHLPGVGSYSSTKIDTSKGERWFKTERQAIDAGWRPIKDHIRGL